MPSLAATKIAWAIQALLIIRKSTCAGVDGFGLVDVVIVPHRAAFLTVRQYYSSPVLGGIENAPAARYRYAPSLKQ